VDLEFTGHSDHSANALHRLLSGDGLRDAGNVAGESDGPVMRSDTEVRSVNTRVPPQLGHDEILQCRVGSLHEIPPPLELTVHHKHSDERARAGRAVGPDFK
jgi:hypothetical protein